MSLVISVCSGKVESLFCKCRLGKRQNHSYTHIYLLASFTQNSAAAKQVAGEMMRNMDIMPCRGDSIAVVQLGARGGEGCEFLAATI